MNVNCDESPCGLDVALAVVGGKWKPLILYHLNSGPKRFGDLRRLVAGISEKVLIQQLRELAVAGVLTRHDYQRVPPMVDYTMTPFGMTLAQALDAAVRLGNGTSCPGRGGHGPARGRVGSRSGSMCRLAFKQWRHASSLWPDAGSRSDRVWTSPTVRQMKPGRAVATSKPGSSSSPRDVGSRSLAGEPCASPTRTEPWSRYAPSRSRTPSPLPI